MTQVPPGRQPLSLELRPSIDPKSQWRAAAGLSERSERASTRRRFRRDFGFKSHKRLHPQSFRREWTPRCFTKRLLQAIRVPVESRFWWLRAQRDPLKTARTGAGSTGTSSKVIPFKRAARPRVEPLSAYWSAATGSSPNSEAAQVPRGRGG